MYIFCFLLLSSSVAVNPRSDGSVLLADPRSPVARSSGMREENPRPADGILAAPIANAVGSLLQFTIDRGEQPSQTKTASVDKPWENIAGNLGSDFGNADKHKWTDYSILDEKNWCRHMADAPDMEADCSGTSSQAVCSQRWMRKDGASNNGNFTQCAWDAAANACQPGREYVCTWSFFMYDLQSKQNKTAENCFSALLESKRSLDGLLDSVNDTFRDLMAQNDIIEAMNVTIRSLLDDQQREWNGYLDDQAACVSDRERAYQDLIAPVEKEMEELRTIANPTVRSAVDFSKATGYQKDKRAGYEVSAENKAKGISFFQDEEARSAFIQESMAMDLSADAAACSRFASLVSTMEAKHGKKFIKSDVVDCHEQRRLLQEHFNTAFMTLANISDETNQTIMDNFTECLSMSTFDYKSAVEGVNGIDPKIQTAAKEIHSAQSRIAMLEPRLHDVENAVNKMRSYINTLNSTCALDESINIHLKRVQTLIMRMNECPGRNDFYLTIPHWEVTDVPTPSPTPWAQRP